MAEGHGSPAAANSVHTLSPLRRANCRPPLLFFCFQWATYNRRFRLGKKDAWWEVPLDTKLGLSFTGGPAEGRACGARRRLLLRRTAAGLPPAAAAGNASACLRAAWRAGSPHVEVGIGNLPLALTLAAGLLLAGKPLSVSRKEASRGQIGLLCAELAGEQQPGGRDAQPGGVGLARWLAARQR